MISPRSLLVLNLVILGVYWFLLRQAAGPLAPLEGAAPHRLAEASRSTFSFVAREVRFTPRRAPAPEVAEVTGEGKPPAAEPPAPVEVAAPEPAPVELAPVVAPPDPLEAALEAAEAEPIPPPTDLLVPEDDRELAAEIEARALTESPIEEDPVPAPEPRPVPAPVAGPAPATEVAAAEVPAPALVLAAAPAATEEGELPSAISLPARAVDSPDPGPSSVTDEPPSVPAPAPEEDGELPVEVVAAGEVRPAPALAPAEPGEPPVEARSPASGEVAGDEDEPALAGPTTVEIYQARVRAADRMIDEGKLGTAASTLRTVLALEDVIGEQRAWALFLLAKISRRKGDHRGAARLYGQAIDHDPPGALYKNSLAWIMATSRDRTVRDPDAAVRLAEEAVRDGGARGSFLDTLARAYFEAGRLHDAVRTQERAVAMIPKRASFRNRLSWYRQEWGKQGGAVLAGAP